MPEQYPGIVLEDISWAKTMLETEIKKKIKQIKKKMRNIGGIRTMFGQSPGVVEL